MIILGINILVGLGEIVRLFRFQEMNAHAIVEQPSYIKTYESVSVYNQNISIYSIT